ncbi:MAG: hypothetical protein QXK76_01465 [Candidatus Woesearchaeota archaeon]
MKKILLLFVFVFSLYSILFYVNALNASDYDAGGNVLCKSLPLPDKDLWEKCEQQGLVLVNIVRDGCVVGYDCESLQSGSSRNYCALDIAPPSNIFCNECHNKGMIVKKKLQNNCVVGYECVESVYMSARYVDECKSGVSCPPVKPALDVVNDCAARGGTLNVLYNEKCEATFECVTNSADIVPFVGCPVYDVPENVESACEEKKGRIIVRYDANCNPKFECITRFNSTNNTIINNTINNTTNNTNTFNITNTTNISVSDVIFDINYRCVDPTTLKEYSDLIRQLRQKLSDRSREVDVTDLRVKILRLGEIMRQQSRQCDREIGIGVRCQIPEYLNRELSDALKEYRELLNSPNDVDLTPIRNKIAEIGKKIDEYKKKCMQNTVPGQTGTARCVIPEEMLKELESLYKQYNALLKSMQASDEQLRDIKKKIDNLERNIILIKARCNRLPIDNSTNSSQISDYYSLLMAEVLSETADDYRIRELRIEAEDAIKDYLRERQRLNLNDFSGIVDEVSVTPDDVSIGETASNIQNAEIETMVNGENVVVSKENNQVFIRKGLLKIKVPQLLINNSNITINGTAIVIPKNLENKNVRQIILENTDDGLKYLVKVDSKRRILGIIPITAKQEMILNAENGEIIRVKGPWWMFISNEVKNK